MGGRNGQAQPVRNLARQIAPPPAGIRRPAPPASPSRVGAQLTRSQERALRVADRIERDGRTPKVHAFTSQQNRWVHRGDVRALCAWGLLERLDGGEFVRVTGEGVAWVDARPVGGRSPSRR